MDRHKYKYIQFGGGTQISAAKAKHERELIFSAVRAGARELERLGMRKEARLAIGAITREWQQMRSPYYGEVSNEEYRALSSALRWKAFDPDHTPPYQQEPKPPVSQQKLGQEVDEAEWEKWQAAARKRNEMLQGRWSDAYRKWCTITQRSARIPECYRYGNR